MAVEAQKLIAVSLGKIQACRQQRGGPSLHKSLLVSSVLHKARTTYMMENFQTMMAKRAQQVEAQKGQCLEPVVVRPSHEENTAGNPCSNPEPPRPERPESPKRVRAEKCAAEDKENSPPPLKRQDSVDSSVVNQRLGISEKLNSENDKENDSVITKDCAKCSKRRLTDAQEPNINECPSPKRAKTESESCDSTSEVEPMQTDSQITSLVQKFNSGLSNFLGSNSGHVASKNNSSHASDSLNGHGQGHSDSIISNACSTQVNKDTFVDSLSSRPAIALTV